MGRLRYIFAVAVLGGALAAPTSAQAPGAQTVTAVPELVAGVSIGVDGGVGDSATLPVVVRREWRGDVQVITVIPR